MTDGKILMITPATDWFAVYTDRSADVGSCWYMTAPIACWCLVEYRDGSRRVQGFEGSTAGAGDGLVSAEGTSRFLRYVNAAEMDGDSLNREAETHALRLQADSCQ